VPSFDQFEIATFQVLSNHGSSGEDAISLARQSGNFAAAVCNVPQTYELLLSKTCSRVHHPIVQGTGDPPAKEDSSMIRLSIRRKIMGIAVALIFLMAVTAVLSMVSVMQVGERLEALTQSYIPAYGDLARANIRSVERGLALRRMVIEKMKSSSSAERFAAIRSVFDAKGAEGMRETQAALALIQGLIEKRVWRYERAGST
jgi:hypothetical protein